MKRLIAPAIVILCLGALGWLLASNPGSASADWLGWRIDTTAALVAVLVLLIALATAGLWTAILWLVRTPARSARGRAETRRAQYSNALAKGWLALSAGDAAEARRLAAEARGLDEGVLPRLLAAQAAEAADDAAAAQTAWVALLDVPEARTAARAGLARLEARRPAPADPEPPPFPAEPLVAEPLRLG
jgi:HemY protein